MKKFLSILLALVLALSVIGCGKKDEPKDDTPEQDDIEVQPTEDYTHGIPKLLLGDSSGEEYREYAEVSEYCKDLEPVIQAGLSGDYAKATELIQNKDFLDKLEKNGIGFNIGKDITVYLTFSTLNDKGDYIYFNFNQTNGVVSDCYDLIYRQKDGKGFSLSFESEVEKVARDTRFAVGDTKGYLLSGAFTEVFYTYNEYQQPWEMLKTLESNAVDEMYNGDIVIHEKQTGGYADDVYMSFVNGIAQDKYTDSDGQPCDQKKVYTEYPADSNDHKVGDEFYKDECPADSPTYIFSSDLLR